MSNPALETEKIEISFIYNSERIQTEMDANAEQIALLRKLEVSREAPSAFQVMTIGSIRGGSAVHLVETIIDAQEMDKDDEGEVTRWDMVQELAVKIDKAAEGSATTPLLVEFIWDNGGGDDNLFGHDFSANVAGPENEALLDCFIENLEEAGSNSGWFYDFSVSVSNCRMDLSGLVDWTEDKRQELAEEDEEGEMEADPKLETLAEILAKVEQAGQVPSVRKSMKP